MKQIFFRRGEPVVVNVTDPIPKSGGVVVEVTHSCFSRGTELAALDYSGKSLVERVLDEPAKISFFLEICRRHGVRPALMRVMQKMHQYTASGYSCSGEIVSVGKGAEEFQVGDLVACSGAKYAMHATKIWVPKNLVVRLPKNISLAQGSLVSLGAIALHATRRAECRFGELAVVVGLGTLGLLISELLLKQSVGVIGLDQNPVAADLTRDLLSIETFASKNPFADIGHVSPDCIIIACHFDSKILNQAASLLPVRGRLVLVGDGELAIDRDLVYRKELEIIMSTSTGPGRYDRNYEEHGFDYPKAYVRWTQKRNMEAFLRVAASLEICRNANLAVIEIKNDNVTDAFDALKTPPEGTLFSVMSFRSEVTESKALSQCTKQSAVFIPKKNLGSVLNVGLIGIGGYAQSAHIPNLAKLEKVRIAAICNDKVVVNQNIFGDQKISSFADPEDLCVNAGLDAVIVSTIHNTHFNILNLALENGLAAYVDKPLCMNSDELFLLQQKFESKDTDQWRVMCGFNRRYSEAWHGIKSEISNRQLLFADYLINAKPLVGHWLNELEVGGGRHLGEAIHFYDLVLDLFGHQSLSLCNLSEFDKEGNYDRGESFSVQLEFGESGIATINYVAFSQNKAFKERLSIMNMNDMVEVIDFAQVRRFGSRLTTNRLKNGKGDFEATVHFINAVKSGLSLANEFRKDLATHKVVFNILESRHVK